MITQAESKALEDQRDEIRLNQVIRQRVGIHTATDAAILAGLVEQGKLVRRLVRKTQDGTIGKESGTMPEEEDTSINVGDMIIHNYQSPDTKPEEERAVRPAPQPSEPVNRPSTSGGDNTSRPQTPPANQTDDSSLWKKVLPWVLAGALGAGSTGLGVWMTSGNEEPSPKEETGQTDQPESGPDINTEYDLGFTDPKKPTEWDR